MALALRWWRARQCLWADEIESLLHYVAGPWRVVVAAGPGQYVPNDHPLYNVLAKVCLTLGAGGQVDPVGRAALCVRLPSVVAGALVPVALAWPWRRRAPGAALLVAVLAAVHPWLIAQSAEARGYALMTLLGLFATARLPQPGRRWPVGYALAVAAAVYTVPVALILFVGHGLVVIATRRDTLRPWLRGVLLAAVFTAALYAPLAPGLLDYYRHPLAGPNNNADFANQLPRFALFGRYLPASYDPANHIPSPWIGIGYWLVPVAIVGFGTYAARRRRPDLWPVTAVLLAASAVGALLTLVTPTAGQVRFVPWAALLMCAAITATILSLKPGVLRCCLIAVAIATLTWSASVMPAEQPEREAISLADRIAPPGVPIVLPFFGGDDVARLYAGAATAHRLVPAGPPPLLAAVDAECHRRLGQGPWLVVSFEFLVRDARPDVWQAFDARYRLVRRLPGRTSPVAIYAPRD